jgi:hypothetical protein
VMLGLSPTTSYTPRGESAANASAHGAHDGDPASAPSVAQAVPVPSSNLKVTEYAQGGNDSAAATVTRVTLYAESGKGASTTGTIRSGGHHKLRRQSRHPVASTRESGVVRLVTRHTRWRARAARWVGGSRWVFLERVNAAWGTHIEHYLDHLLIGVQSASGDNDDGRAAKAPTSAARGSTALASWAQDGIRAQVGQRLSHVTGHTERGQSERGLCDGTNRSSGRAPARSSAESAAGPLLAPY